MITGRGTGAVEQRRAQHAAYLRDLAALLRQAGLSTLVSQRVHLVIHGDTYGPRSSVTFHSPELDVRSCSGEPLATVTIDDQRGHLAFLVRPCDDESQWPYPIDSPSEAVDAVLSACCPVREINDGG
jgi:hypothetical protein